MHVLSATIAIGLATLLYGCGESQTPVSYFPPPPPVPTQATRPVSRPTSALPRQEAQRPSPQPTSGGTGNGATRPIQVPDLASCAEVGRDYRTSIAFETASYAVNICQQRNSGRYVYLGQDKRQSQQSIRVNAYPVDRGYRADNRNISYVVVNRNNRWRLNVLQNGEQILQEAAIGEALTGNDSTSRPASPPSYPSPQTNYRLRCTGDISNRNLYFAVFYTRESGFNQFELRDRGTNRLVASGVVAYDSRNDLGQPIFRGSSSGADIVVVGLAPRYQEPGSKITFDVDGQRGRGTCRQITSSTPFDGQRDLNDS